MKATEIRKLYLPGWSQDERLCVVDPNPVGETTTKKISTRIEDGRFASVYTMETCLHYNMVDSQLVLKIASAQNILKLAHEFAGFFSTGGLEAVIRGNSNTLPLRIEIAYLEDGKFLGCGLRSDSGVPVLESPESLDDLRRLQNFSFDSEEVLKFGEKGFGGGANDAVKGIFPLCRSGDFQSFYPNIACEFDLSLENVAVLLLGSIENDVALGLDEFIDEGKLSVFDYVLVLDSIQNTSKARNIEIRSIYGLKTSSPPPPPSRKLLFVRRGAEFPLTKLFLKLLEKRKVRLSVCMCSVCSPDI